MNSEDSEHKYDAESAEEKLEVPPSPQSTHMSHLFAHWHPSRYLKDLAKANPLAMASVPSPPVRHSTLDFMKVKPGRSYY